MAATDPPEAHKFYKGRLTFDLRRAGGRGAITRGMEICLTDDERDRIEALEPGTLRHVAHRDCECQETCDA